MTWRSADVVAVGQDVHIHACCARCAAQGRLSGYRKLVALARRTPAYWRGLGLSDVERPAPAWIAGTCMEYEGVCIQAIC